MSIFKRFISVLIILVLTASLNVFAIERLQVPLVTPPNKTVFYEGKDWGYYNSNILEYVNFDLTGASVKYKDNIIKYANFPWGPNMYAEPVSGKWVVGKNAVDIHVDDIDSFNGDVYAVSELTLVAIKKLEIVSCPRNMTLIEGVNWHYDRLNTIVPDEIDLAGLSIKITYTDNTTETLTYSNITKDMIKCELPPTTDNLVLGKNLYLIKYCSKSADIYFDFVAEQISRAALSKAPDLADYHYKTNWTYSGGQISPQINLKGLEVTAVYNNGKKETVSYNKSPGRFSVKASQHYFSGPTRCTVLLDNKFEFNINIFIYRYGDINFDGSINSSDALSVLRYSVSSEAFDSNQKKYADVNADSKINSTDALYILNYSVGVIAAFAAEK
ncbi:MAG: dockerin type I repeat-containing protein [Clostridia bacterium]|nr:dockerin type I repeat-containing protein [Clostridia bacterium]